MGIKQSSGAQTTFVSYSNFLGGFYIEDKRTKDLLAQAKDIAGGQEQVLKGFVGKGADTASGKARNLLAENKVPFGFHVEGNLSLVQFKEIDGANSTKVPYLKIFLQDTDSEGNKESFIISVDMKTQLAGKLIQKLEYAAPGERIDVSAWADYAPSEKDGRSYAEHNASIKRGGQEIKVPEGVKHYENIKVRVEDRFARLEKAGFSRTDPNNKETFAKQRQASTLDYFKDILENKIAPKFKTTDAAKAGLTDALSHDANREPTQLTPDEIPTPDLNEFEEDDFIPTQRFG